MPSAAPARAGTSNPHRLLLLAYHFPPQVGAAAARAASLARWLPEFGWDVEVITVSDGFHPSAAGADRAWLCEVERTRSLELSRWARRAVTRRPLDDSEPLVLGSRQDRLRRWVREWCYVPDSRAGWIPFARLALKRALAKDSRSTIVYSTSVPYSAHFAAWASLGPRTRWVAEFRDPWSEAPALLRPRSATRRALDERMHRLVLQRADRIVVTSNATAAELVSARGLAEDRLSVVPNGFEPVPTSVPPGADQSCLFQYVGTVSEGEDVEPLLRGLQRARSVVGDRLRFRVVGPTQIWQAALRQIPGLENTVHLVGTTDGRTASEFTGAASANVVLSWLPFLVTIPGKVFEYLGARRPVIAAVPPGSEAAALLSDYGVVEFVDGADEGAWAEAFLEIARRHQDGALSSPMTGRKSVEELTRRTRAQQLAVVLDALVGAA